MLSRYDTLKKKKKAITEILKTFKVALILNFN